MRAGVLWVLAAAGGLLATACAGTEEGSGREVIGSDWQFVERDYPFIADDGSLVCAEYQRHEGNGLFAQEREFYRPERMNDKLAGRLPMTGRRARLR